MPYRGYHFVSPSPPFPYIEVALFRYRKLPPFCGKSYYFYRISCMNPLFSPTGIQSGAKGDAKWWPSIRCMFDWFSLTKGPNLEKKTSHLTFSVSLKTSISLEQFKLHLQNWRKRLRGNTIRKSSSERVSERTSENPRRGSFCD